MDKRTLTALKGSIKKWEKIVAREGIDRGCDNCPLCKAFPTVSCCSFSDGTEDLYNLCPVAEAGHTLCEDTPYEEFNRMVKQQLGEDVEDPSLYTDDMIKVAQEEVDFLKSLLPKGD